tara:strand:- start:53 stop:880 length:828 start_codon:yes stop_codon:yes gene_type:complete
MSNYIKSTDFAVKDGLLTGNPLKIVSGTEINDEFNAIQTAVGTKANTLSPTLTGVPLAVTAPLGTNTTQLATTAFVQNNITAPTAAPGTNTTQVATTAFVQNVAGALGTMSSQNATSVAITGGTITGITDLTVADGGTGQSTLAANAVLVGNGTSGINSVAPSTSGNVLTSNGTTWTSAENARIGVGQTWQNVKASRALGTTYTNSTGKPIQVSIVGNVGYTTASLYVAGLLVSQMTNQFGDRPLYSFLSTIVPDGVSYYVTSPIFTILHWSELR